MGKFERKVKRQFAKDAVKKYKDKHKGLKLDPKTETWIEPQKPYLKSKETLAQYQARQIKKNISKIGGKD